MSLEAEAEAEYWRAISWMGVRLTMRVNDFGRSARRVVMVGTSSKGSDVDYGSKGGGC